MAVYQDKKRGTWYCVITYNVNGKKKSTTKRGFELKRHAVAYEVKFKEEKLYVLPDDDATFGSMYLEYIENVSYNVKPRTLEKYKGIYNAFLSDYGAIKLSGLSTSQIQKIANSIKSKDLSCKYRNTGLWLLKAILIYSNNIYDTNFKTHFINKIPMSSSEVVIHDTWDNFEFNKFIESVDNPVYRSFFIFLYRTGARRGEAIALLSTDLCGEYVTINKSMRSANKGSSDTKTISSIRSILLDKDTLESICETKHGKYLFGGDTPLSPSGIARAFTSAIKKSGVKAIRLHDLRHSHATNLINNGANIVAVSKRLGHSDTSMTLKVYTHLLQKTERDLLNYL